MHPLRVVARNAVGELARAAGRRGDYPPDGRGLGAVCASGAREPRHDVLLLEPAAGADARRRAGAGQWARSAAAAAPRLRARAAGVPLSRPALLERARLSVRDAESGVMGAGDRASLESPRRVAALAWVGPLDHTAAPAAVVGAAAVGAACRRS